MLGAGARSGPLHQFDLLRVVFLGLSPRGVFAAADALALLT
jgi:hypothetical protein